MVQSKIREEDVEAKRRFIKAYFEDFEKKIDFLNDLFKSGHKDEALTLCCCYIEYLGGGCYFPREKSKMNFVSILREYGNNDLYYHIHPTQLQRSFEGGRSPRRLKAIIKKLNPILEKTDSKLYSEQEILTIAQDIVDQSELDLLKNNLWKGTYAAIAYEWIRNKAVHKFGAIDVSFSNTTFRGRPVPKLEFRLLYSALKSAFKIVKEESLMTSVNYNSPLTTIKIPD